MAERDDDAQTLQDVRAQQEAQAAAEEAADEAQAAGATPTEQKAAALEAAREALADYRLHDDDVDRIARRQVEVLREAGAFDPPTPPPRVAAGEAPTGIADPAGASPTSPEPTPPPVEAPQPPRKLSLAERYAGVTEADG